MLKLGNFYSKVRMHKSRKENLKGITKLFSFILITLTYVNHSLSYTAGMNMQGLI